MVQGRIPKHFQAAAFEHVSGAFVMTAGSKVLTTDSDASEVFRSQVSAARFHPSSKAYQIASGLELI